MTPCLHTPLCPQETEWQSWATLYCLVSVPAALLSQVINAAATRTSYIFIAPLIPSPIQPSSQPR